MVLDIEGNLAVLEGELLKLLYLSYLLVKCVHIGRLFFVLLVLPLTVLLQKTNDLTQTSHLDLDALHSRLQTNKGSGKEIIYALFHLVFYLQRFVLAR